jgi:hypothetical protein
VAVTADSNPIQPATVNTYFEAEKKTSNKRLFPTYLLRVGNLFRWLCKVCDVCYTDTPFKSWSPEVNCRKKKPNPFTVYNQRNW